MQAGPRYITVRCLSLEYGRHMMAALWGPAAHYFGFINITLAQAPKLRPLTAEKLPVDTLIFQLAQQRKGSFALAQPPNDNGTSTEGGGGVSR